MLHDKVIVMSIDWQVLHPLQAREWRQSVHHGHWKKYPNHQQLLEQCIGRLNGLTTFSKSMAKTIRTEICDG